MEKNVVLKPQRLMDARQLVIAGLLVGITVFLGLSGYGFIPLFTINATILHVPTIIGAIVAGPKVGCMVGFFFGLFSFIQSFRSPAIMLQFAQQYNVLYGFLICIVPRVTIGFIAWWIYKHILGRILIRATVTSVLTTLLHTGLFLSFFYMLVGAPFATHQGMSLDAFRMMLEGVAVTNGLPEAALAGVIVAPIVIALTHAHIIQ